MEFSEIIVSIIDIHSVLRDQEAERRKMTTQKLKRRCNEWWVKGELRPMMLGLVEVGHSRR